MIFLFFSIRPNKIRLFYLIKKKLFFYYLIVVSFKKSILFSLLVYLLFYFNFVFYLCIYSLFFILNNPPQFFITDNTVLVQHPLMCKSNCQLCITSVPASISFALFALALLSHRQSHTYSNILCYLWQVGCFPILLAIFCCCCYCCFCFFAKSMYFCCCICYAVCSSICMYQRAKHTSPAMTNRDKGIFLLEKFFSCAQTFVLNVLFVI